MFAHRGVPETGWISQIAAFLRCFSGAPDAAAATGRILKRPGGLCGRRAGSALRGGGLRASAAQQQRARKRGGGDHDERGGAGVTGEGDCPWVWLVNVNHLYWVRDGLQVAAQKIHPHGHGWSIANNVDAWSWA